MLTFILDMVRTRSFGRGTDTVLSQSSNILREKSCLISFETCTTGMAGKGVIARQASLLFYMLITLPMPNFEVYIAKGCTTLRVRAPRFALTFARNFNDRWTRATWKISGHVTDTSRTRTRTRNRHDLGQETDMSEYGILQTTKLLLQIGSPRLVLSLVTELCQRNTVT